MERKTLEEKREARDYAVLVGLRSPVLGEDSADEESLMELSELVETAAFCDYFVNFCPKVL